MNFAYSKGIYNRVSTSLQNRGGRNIYCVDIKNFSSKDLSFLPIFSDFNKLYQPLDAYESFPSKEIFLLWQRNFVIYFVSYSFIPQLNK